MNFTQPTLITFSYNFDSQDGGSDPSASLALYAYTPLNVPVVQLATPLGSSSAAGGGAGGGAWSSASLCMPSGSYYLAFVATHGQPYVTNIALDNVLIDPTPCNVTDLIANSERF